MKIKNLLKKWVLNNIGYKILAVVLAIVMWLVIMNTTNPQTSKTITNIPVTITNEQMVLDGDHVYSVKEGETATITITGSRNVINSLYASDFEAYADFSKLSMTNAVPITVELKADKAKYASQIEINIKTTSMVIVLENIDSKVMEVEINYTGLKPEDMIVDSSYVSVVPETVKIAAPESVLRNISQVLVNVPYSEIEKEEGTVRCIPIIYGSNGAEIQQTEFIKLDTSEVLVNVTPLFKKEVYLVPVVAGIPAPGYQYDGVELSSEKITIKGPSRLIREVSAITLDADKIYVDEATKDVVKVVDLTKYLPEGITVFGEETTVTVTAKISKIPETTTAPTSSESTEETESSDTTEDAE